MILSHAAIKSNSKVIGMTFPFSAIWQSYVIHSMIIKLVSVITRPTTELYNIVFLK